MKVYISGPMTGYVNYNYEAFEAAEKKLREKGYEPVNPHKLPEHAGHDQSYGEFMRIDIRHLTHCKAICPLEGWQGSVGARGEMHVARLMGIQTIMLEGA